MSILDPALRNALRTLKLTGMLETLDARLAQTRDGTLGHLDFLQVLCEDEIARRESAALTRRIRRARFEEQSTFESFDFTANTKLPAAMLRAGFDEVYPPRPRAAGRRCGLVVPC
jgi:DNA replication protein DnaC